MSTDDNVALRGSLWAMLLTALVGFMVAGAALGSIALFRSYDGVFARLMATDTRLAQQLYNDSVSRALEDALLQQENAETNAALAIESMTRAANFFSLYWAITNETAARIAEEAPLFSGIANETIARIAADTYLAAEISNLTSRVVSAEMYQAFSEATFALIISNITNLQRILANEIAARIAGDALLTEQGAIADAAIAYLTTTLENDIHERMVQDVLINEWIAALQAMGTGIESINGQTGHINNNVDIISTNALTTITAPSPGQLLFTNNAVLTVQGAVPNGADNLGLQPGAGMSIFPSGPHGVVVASLYSPIPPNSIVLSGYRGFNMDFDGQISSAWQMMTCNFFPTYNGGNCGWSAPDTGTYIVDVSATVTVCVSTPNGVFPTAVHINMALAKSTVDYAMAHASLTTEEEGGILEAADGSFVGDALIISGYCMDMGLSATTVAEGPGSPGCWQNCGYGVWAFFNGYIQGISVEPISMIYRVTKVA